jgi:site-specific DNA-methyltransferase (adenine-specific)
MKNPLPIDKIIVGDCVKVLRGIPDNSVDVCFADPPFNLRKRYRKYDDRKEQKEYLDWCKHWICELVRVTKPTGSIFVHNLPKWLTHYAAILDRLAHFRHWVAWDAMSAPLGKTLMPAHYGILFYTKSPKGFKFHEIRAPHKRCRLCDGFLKDYGGKVDQRHAFGQLVSDVWTDIHRLRHRKRRDEHPCQLPIHLLERVILMSTDPGDVVLDPFLGTGTTAIAAKQLGRHFIGIEMDRTYARIAREKVQSARASRFEGFYVSHFLGKLQTVRNVDAQKLFPPQLTKQQKRARVESGQCVTQDELFQFARGKRASSVGFGN